jgi:hypothetical protein
MKAASVDTTEFLKAAGAHFNSIKTNFEISQEM